MNRSIPSTGDSSVFGYEIIDAAELARRLKVKPSWVKEQVRTRTSEQIPHLRLGKYCRFLWGSPELAAWFAQRRRA